VAALARRMVPVDLPAKAVIFRRGERIAKVYLLVHGRVRLSLPTLDNGRSTDIDSAPGDLLGAIALIESECSLGDMVALEPVQLLAMEGGAFLEAFQLIPRLGFNLIRRLTKITKQVAGAERAEAVATTVAVAWKGRQGRRLLEILERELAGRGERIARAVPGDLDRGEEWAKVLRGHDRIVVEADLDRVPPDWPARVARCDRLWWLMDASSEPALREAARALAGIAPGAAKRLEVVWMLPRGLAVPPSWDPAWNLERRHLMLELPEEGQELTRRERLAVDRLVRRLRGVTLGLALAGGGARGMAHLGVLRCFERAGIGFDLMSGTSCGAMVGIIYAAGYDPDFAIASFKKDLTLPWLFRLLPKGPTWYVFWKYRSRAWEGMLRRYFQDWTLERLPLPFYAVTVDLVRGSEVVLRSGDAVRAILESINLPVISPPIVHDGMALVDGGVLNNLPADVLTREGADLVVGIDVSSKLRDEFGGIRPGTASPLGKAPGSLETIIRVLETQGRGLGTLRAQSMDLTIEPDASSFSFVDFSKAPELADAGEAAAERALPRLRALIAEAEVRVAARGPASAPLSAPRPSDGG